MSLFKKNKPIKEPFDKDKVKKNIQDNFSKMALGWSYLWGVEGIDADFICVKSVIVNEEIKITDNPFSQFKKIVPTKYTKILAIFIADPDETMDEEHIEWACENVIISSAYDLFRKLNE